MSSRPRPRSSWFKYVRRMWKISREKDVAYLIEMNGHAAGITKSIIHADIPIKKKKKMLRRLHTLTMKIRDRLVALGVRPLPPPPGSIVRAANIVLVLLSTFKDGRITARKKVLHPAFFDLKEQFPAEFEALHFTDNESFPYSKELDDMFNDFTFYRAVFLESPDLRTFVMTPGTKKMIEKEIRPTLPSGIDVQHMAEVLARSISRQNDPSINTDGGEIDDGPGFVASHDGGDIPLTPDEGRKFFEDMNAKDAMDHDLPDVDAPPGARVGAREIYTPDQWKEKRERVMKTELPGDKLQ